MYSDLGTPLASPVVLSRPPSSLVFTTSPPPKSPSPPFPGYPAKKSKGVELQSSPNIFGARSPVPHHNDGDGSSMITLLVEGRLFKVHRYFLERDSLFFQGILLMSQSEHNQAIEIRNVSCEQFESLLNFFYDGMYRLTPNAVPMSEWVNLLSVTSTLHFDKARKHAIAAIDASADSLDPVQMIVLGQKYDIQKWLRPAYISLCSRTEPLRLAEAEKVGLSVFVKLSQAREEALREEIRVDHAPTVRPSSPWGAVPPSVRPSSPSSARTSSRAPTPVARPLANSSSRVARIVDKIFFAPPYFPN